MDEVIEVEGLSKSFRVGEKEPGFMGSLRALFSPRHREIEAVGGISFSLKEGEILSFIGPNGAGKSTTLKMLTGILRPSGGRATVLGKVPWEDREQLSREIGAVFGQKSQLWYHLPPIDTFHLLARIYDLDRRVYRERLDRIVELFDLASFLGVPTRKLSLGQRMRAEIAASLLHGPRVLLLDEPTIGLDVVAKTAVRDLIRKINREDKVTVILTSHDVGDMEKLARRVVIIHHGRKVVDMPVQALKRRFFHHKLISVKLREELGAFELEGVDVLKKKGAGMKLRVDLTRASLERVISFLVEKGGIVDMNITTPPLEEIIASIYATRSAGAGSLTSLTEEETTP